ncbi:hypothetical protein NOX90_06160 [Wolbachia endosymbiont of Anurida maritima]|uniref:hypothetical protein n=1 Tax=Wolbachia endosymbiont of Anurida maritima TaxID=2850562 RepID=UPI0035CFEC8B
MPPFSCNNSSLCLFCVTFNTYAQCPYDIIPVRDTGSLYDGVIRVATSVSSQCSYNVIPVRDTGI